ncbi:uncharacterized protein LOC110850957 [Folsomia candida]|uniref:Uncharacterized protein n=1 Tax=Folsomia candida TaxID=158441 RepID=A0A226E857_FOLCA|nr:uncharacterized protein LOC110850957 [Folsomia candida]XP_021954264.1 uncharacterized protein LOC110850957 [Folsomia candida]XP_035708751.1 uncharacterized protein LOC110850957 [Folsomia candida]XP_035708752.1 uncharacterized protein LOC110850957 [Folsomia candida]XP_035708753.1 uncharacterized protein LOC110850957 [Folsomia candida]XP_035708754.1 uncharacterized protein LOC110850957 [Folsomia candida]OXA53274.1 hypothetical protein Fcan01_11971 [Folsomia candida]
MLNPCCCISPRIGTFCLAIVDLILVVPFAWDVIVVFIKHFEMELLGDLILAVFLVFLAILLLAGAIQNSQEKVRLWLTLWLVFIIVLLILQIFSIYHGGRVNVRAGGSLGALLLFIYEIWVVYAYLTELRYGPSGLTYCPAQVV